MLPPATAQYAYALKRENCLNNKKKNDMKNKHNYSTTKGTAGEFMISLYK